MTATAVPVTLWAGCYSDSWQDLIVPEAFSHPAKAARGLSHRIYRHLLESGYVRPGDTILDPFAGIGGFCLDAMTYGLRYIGVELESRFVDLAQQNLALWRQRYGFTGGTVVQGDSRQLRAVLAGAQVGCVVGSPPYEGLPVNDNQRFARNGHDWLDGKPFDGPTPYGTTPGQLGAMPPGALVSSPPYAGAGEVLGTHNGIDYSKAKDGGKVATPARQASGEGYGHSTGQLGAMPIGAVVSSNLASNKNHDRINHTVLSDLKEDACQPAKTAELPSRVEADGVSRAAESMSVQRSKAVRSQQATEPRLPLLATTHPCRTVGENPTRTGQAGGLPGEAMHGKSSAVLPLSVTSSAVCDVAALSDCKSIISSIKTRQGASGITNLITWKRSVQDATLGTTEGRSSWRVVPFVEPGPRELPARNAVLMPVGLKSRDELPGSTTEPMLKSSCASHAELPCHTEANGTNTAPMPVGIRQTMPSDELSEPSTFWSASSQIMAELAALLPPGAVCAWVLKAYVSKKAIVPFPDQWRALCEQHGFQLVEEIHASLVEHHGTQEGLFDGPEVVQTARKSFFRRLAEKKGSPRIDYETVLIMRKAGDVGGVCVVSSPPFQACLHQSEGGMLAPHQQAVYGRDEGAASVQARSYGTTPGNLGTMPVERR